MKKKTDKQKLLQIKDAAEMLGVSERTVWSWIRSGELESVRIGGIHRINREYLEERIKGK